MKGATLDSKNLKLEIMPEGQELIKDVINLTTNTLDETRELSGNDLAVVVGDALMYYKILLEHKSKGGEVILKLNNQQVNLPVIATIDS